MHLCSRLLSFYTISVKKGDLKVCTIEGYKSAIAATLNARGANVGTDPYIYGLVVGLYTDRPVEISLVHTCSRDLMIVRDTLTKSPFELQDMASVELKLLTFKTVFLLSWPQGPDKGKYMH